MRKIIASTLVTLDGVVEDPGGMAGSEHGGWANRYFGEVGAMRSLERLNSCDYFLCGRRTYEMFSKAWPNSSGPYADRLNDMPKLVASTTLAEPLTWNATLLKGDAVRELAKIRAEDGGDIMMYGSATLMWSLLEHGLVDELNLWICPIVLATGQQLFARGRPRVELELTEQTDLHTGVVIASYRPLQTATT
ncbi:dihydrofolate reductase family protein [Pseudonocardia sp. TRM90224]|uniref:dihydrofolate reductase family protein n=1 Tax=Pseudonocardia sp. TRM90224 TaxID=2812678 RepID=UPI002104D964|nr:dihydrofolate reductase family protein [Pseudonocardia sp. TRM90224]